MLTRLLAVSLLTRSTRWHLLGLALSMFVGEMLGPARAAVPRQPGFQPQVFAIQDARIILRPGEGIDRGTLVIRHGRIAAVGEDIDPPADARVIDGNGLTIYAGFIDAGASRLLRKNDSPDPVEGRSVEFDESVLAGTRPDNRRSLTPEYRVREAIKLNDETLEALRKAGLTGVHLLPSGRIAGGQGTLVDSSGRPPRESVLIDTTSAVLRLFAPGVDSNSNFSYPATLMGATAHLRQAFLDAERHAVHRTLYGAAPADVSRPPADPALEALQRILQGEQRPLFRADSRDDIHRALDFAAEHELRPALWGLSKAHEALDRIEREEIELIVDLDFGDKPEIKPSKDEEEKLQHAVELPAPRRVRSDRLRRWKDRIAGLSEMHRRGIRFAFSSRGLNKPRELLKAVRTAVENGLSAEAALAGLTTNAAEILGIEDRLGALEPGKLAHIVVMTGPFDEKDSKVRYVFVDGEKFEYNEDAEPEGDRKDDEKSGKERKPVSAPKPPQEPALPTELRDDRLKRPVQTGGDVLIKNGVVLTGTGKTLSEPGTSILVKEGKIAEIGTDLEAEEGMAVIDASGWHVIPGIIDTHSHIMIDGGVNEYTQSIVPEVRIKDVVETDDVAEYRALAGGVTAARLLHGSANVIGGQDAVVKMKYGGTASEHILDWNPQGVKFALGENVKRRSNRYPDTRLGVEATLIRAFSEAQDYREKWEAHRETADNGDALRLPPRRDLRLEALADVLEDEILIHSHCYRADEVLMLLRVADRFGVKVQSLQHVLEGYKVAPEIAAHGASCSTFSDWWAYKVEAYDATPYNAALLHEAGINSVIKSDNAELMRHLYQEAAKTVRYGNMAPEAALQTITLNAARELGLEDRMGTIEVGKDADLAIFNGHPLNAFARCEMTLIDGEVYFSRKDAPTAMSKEAEQRSADPPELVLPRPEVRARAFEATPSEGGRYALVGATLYPVDGPVIPEGTLLIEDGEIAAVGAEVQVPSDARTIQADGWHVAPGFIDAGTTLGLQEIGAVGETHDYREGGTFQPEVRAGVGVNRDSALIPVARAGGITTALSRPEGGRIAGQGSLVQLAGWTTPEMVLELEAGLQIMWPRGDEERREERIEELDEFFGRARLYHRICKNAETNGGDPPVTDPRLKAMGPYLSGENPVFIEARSREHIAEALKFGKEQELDVVITGGRDAWKMTEQLKKHDVPVIVGPVMRRPVEEWDPFDAPYANPGRLHEAGVKFCIRSDSATNSRNAPFEAAMAVAYGLPEDQALRAVTLSAAEILGIDDELGSLTPGKRAHVVIADGNPLLPTSQIKGVFIDGKPYKAESKQTRLYERYRGRLHEVLAEKGQPEATAPAAGASGE